MRIAEIYDWEGLLYEEKGVVAININAMRNIGLIVDAGGLMIATSEGREFLQKHAKKDDLSIIGLTECNPLKVKTNGRKRRKTSSAPATEDKSVRDLLELMERQAKDMLDKYADVITDPTALHLMYVLRHKTRMALAAWDKKQS